MEEAYISELDLEESLMKAESSELVTKFHDVIAL